MGLCSLPLIYLGPNCGGGNEDNGDLLLKVPCRHCCPQCPQSCRRPLPTHASARDSWTLTGESGSVSCGVTAPFSWVLVHTGSVCALQESVPPFLCKFWWLYGGVNGYHLQEAYTIPSLLHPEPLPLWQFTADPYLHRRHSNTVPSLRGVSGSWCTQGLFDPSECLWWLWGLIIKLILPLLPSYWGFSFALGCEVSPQSHSSATQPLLQHLASSWAFCTLGHGVSPHSHSSAMQPLLQKMELFW